MPNVLKYFLLVVFSFLIISCTSDDDDDNTIDTADQIIGTWRIVSFKINGIESLDNILDDHDGCPFDLIFTSNESYVVEYSGANCSLLLERTPKEYCINETMLIFDCLPEGENGLVEILELTNTSLKYFETNSFGEVERSFIRQ